MQNSKAVVLWWILESVSLEASVFTGAPTVSYILDINLLICLVLVHVSDGGSIYIYIYTDLVDLDSSLFTTKTASKLFYSPRNS